MACVPSMMRVLMMRVIARTVKPAFALRQGLCCIIQHGASHSRPDSAECTHGTFATNIGRGLQSPAAGHRAAHATAVDLLLQ